MEIIELKKGEGAILAAVRLQAAKSDPKAFALSYEQLQKKTKLNWESALSSSKSFVAKEDDEAAGTISLFEDSDGVWVVGSVWVSSKYRGRGLGKSLIEYVLEVAKDEGIRYLELGVNSTLVAAIRLYENVGFRKIKTCPSLPYGDGNDYDLLVMGRYL